MSAIFYENVSDYISSGEDPKKTLENLKVTYQNFNTVLQKIREQKVFFHTREREIQKTIDVLDTEHTEGWIEISNGLYVKGKTIKHHVYLGVGVMLEMEKEDAKVFFNKKQKLIQEKIKETSLLEENTMKEITTLSVSIARVHNMIVRLKETH